MPFLPSLRDLLPSVVQPGVKTPGYCRKSLRDSSEISDARMNITESKDALRKEIRARLKGMTPEQRAAASDRACALLEQQTVWKKAELIFFYAPLPEELDIWRLLADSLAAGKTVALPRFDAATQRYVACQIADVARDLNHGQFGIREAAGHCIAVPPNRLDLVLVPGVAFDLQGRRLGRGKGFYDQMLAAVRGTTCGVAFDEQIVDTIPIEPHDVHLNCILTPTRWIEP
jgi:5-formyltetrahydrofolate cyclo-ligase